MYCPLADMISAVPASSCLNSSIEISWPWLLTLQVLNLWHFVTRETQFSPRMKIIRGSGGGAFRVWTSWGLVTLNFDFWPRNGIASYPYTVKNPHTKSELSIAFHSWCISPDILTLWLWPLTFLLLGMSDFAGTIFPPRLKTYRSCYRTFRVWALYGFMTLTFDLLSSKWHSTSY